MTDLTREQIEALLDGATQGPWQADGEPWNRIVWSSAENRVCFMAHSNGLDDARDIATSNLVAAAPDLARQLLATMTERDEAQAAQAGVVEMCAEIAEEFYHNGGMRNPGHSIRSLADPTGVKLLAELRARAEKGAEVNVKTLSWTEGKFCGQDMFFADTPFGAWMVVRYSGRDFRWAICDPLGNDSDEDWSTPELAMAAAQGDHIARVRAALSAAPTGEESNG